MSANDKSKTLVTEKYFIETQYLLLAEIFSALSHPIRLGILDLLAEAKGLNCSEILEFIKIPKPNLSQHLHVLKKVGLVKSKKQGLYQFYYLQSQQIDQNQKYLTHITTADSDKLSKKNNNKDTQT